MKAAFALLLLPFFAATAFAGPAALPGKKPAPAQLTDAQLDKVSAGFLEIDRSNTSLTVISIFQTPYLTDPTPNTITCPDCYLLIVSPKFSIASSFGQPATPPAAPP